ncbi:MAG: hypothetical protein ACTTKH_07935 [Treponema sp.]
MITLEQVRLLEEKVESLISVVKSLYQERDSLKETLTQKEKRIEELETVLHSFELSQAKIEESVMNALNQLDVFENTVAHDNDSLSSTEFQVNVQSEEFSLSSSSEESMNMEEHSTNITSEANQQENEVEKQKLETDDSDRQMDIF